MKVSLVFLSVLFLGTMAHVSPAIKRYLALWKRDDTERHKDRDRQAERLPD